jgi:putative acetyltransferase
MSVVASAGVELRREFDGEQAAIRTVVLAAFGRADEADLVEAMRSSGELAVSLVACHGTTVVGHVALSMMRSPPRAMGMAPVSVAPEWQGRGIGSALVRTALDMARAHGTATVFVLGHPSFYCRLGFSPEAARPFPGRYAGPHFMAAHLIGSGSPIAPARYGATIEP